MPAFEAQDQLRLITAITFPHWSGDSKNPKESHRQGNRKRSRYLETLRRAARFEPGYTLLTSGEQLVGWFGEHGVETT
jgi:hypothetical protein